MRAELKGLLAGALVVYLAGIWWGVPWLWAPDELGPAIILDGIDARFSGGWHDKYPPMQYYLGAIVYAPFVIASRFGRADLTSYDMTVGLFILLRLITVAMAVGTVLAIYRTADDLYGRRGAFAAALLAAFAPTVVFYAKLANVDAPSLFWFAWSLRYYVRAVRTGEASALTRFAITGVTAIATKDQTFGFYVLPACHLAYLAQRRDAWRPLITAGAVAVAVFALEMNLLFNLRGFLAHVEVATGEASQPFRLHGSTWTRQMLVAKLSVLALAWSMTWVGFAAGLAGVIAELRRRRFLYLLLPVVSYYLFFLVVAGYVYDRFLIGIGFVMAIFAGGLIDGVLRAGVPLRRAGLAACVAAGAFVLWAGVSVDLMMILDSRYQAERWIRAHRERARVGLVGFETYLPHVSGADRITWGTDGPPSEQPRFVVVNAEVMRRRSLPAVERAWQSWLDSGSSPYVVAARFKTLPAASWLSHTDVFRNGVEDDMTNLDKVGPEIVIYWRPGLLR